MTAKFFATKGYPRPPKLETIVLSREDMDKFIDLRPYYNPYPLSVQDRTTVSRCFRLFRAVGLRHMPVVNKYGETVGMISRKDLHESTIHELLHHSQELDTEVSVFSSTNRLGDDEEDEPVHHRK